MNEIAVARQADRELWCNVDTVVTLFRSRTHDQIDDLTIIHKRDHFQRILRDFYDVVEVRRLRLKVEIRETKHDRPAFRRLPFRRLPSSNGLDFIMPSAPCLF